jgi:TonB family protein
MNRREGLARWLIKHAARTAPPSLSERLEEEWLADLEARRGLIERLRLAVGCCWATRVIAHEHCAASVAAAAGATGSRTMTAYAQHHDDTYFSRRSLAFVAIICLHVGIVYALMMGLGPKVFPAFTDRMKVVAVPDVPVHHDPLPPLTTANPTLNLHPLDIPTRELKFDTVADINETLVLPPSDPPSGGGSATMPATPMKRVGGGPGKGFPNTEDFYPAEAARLGEEGTATVQTCVDRGGRLTTAPAIVTPSGVGSLDAGALRLAKAGSGHYRPTTEDGQPVSSCFDFRITFHMTHH